MEGKQREVMISLCVSLFPPLLSFILVSVLIRVANGAQLPDLQLSRDIMFGMPESVRELLVSPRPPLSARFVQLSCIVFVPIYP